MNANTWIHNTARILGHLYISVNSLGKKEEKKPKFPAGGSRFGREHTEGRK